MAYEAFVFNDLADAIEVLDSTDVIDLLAIITIGVLEAAFEIGGDFINEAAGGSFAFCVCCAPFTTSFATGVASETARASFVKTDRLVL